MHAWIQSLHVGWAILLFFGIAVLRSSLVYALGRLASAGGRRLDRVRRSFDSPAFRRAERFVNRWGVLAVPFCFLTIGFQTAVITTTGLTRMPLTRWVPAILLGAAMWGVVYGTVGMAVVWAWLRTPWLLAAVAAVVALVFTAVRIVPRVRRAREDGN